MGYIAAFFIGISLGLIGGGGSILTLPVLVYLFGIAPLQAISYSLFVVGTTSLAGAINNYRKGLVHLKTAFLFGITSVLTVFITRKFIIPVVPDTIQYGSFSITFSLLTLLLFAGLMILASIQMIRGRKEIKNDVAPSHKVFTLSLYGLGIGLITGFLGAGGGFLLIPALALLLRLPMKTAVGTSLLIIAMNSLIGFLGDSGQYKIDWTLLLLITAIAIAGVFIGGRIGNRIPGEKLKKGFGWFVLSMSIYIIVTELFIK